MYKTGVAGKSVGRGPHFRTLAAEKPVGRARFWRITVADYGAGAAHAIGKPGTTCCSQFD